MPLLDTTTPRGRRIATRLRDEVIAWLVTVRRDGQPQPSPVWFLWQDPDILMYSQPDRPKLEAYVDRLLARPAAMKMGG